jgi:hypothetical protein
VLLADVERHCVLPPGNTFWTVPDDNWMAKRAPKNQPFAKDYAIDY